jgi:oxalate---CoA ligase
MKIPRGGPGRLRTLALNAPTATTLLELLDGHARERPDALALAAPSQSPATYAQLASHVSAIAGQLKEVGVARTDRVAVALPNGPEMAAAFLAVSSGAICAPLNPSYRRSEFEFLLTDLSARALIVPAGDVESEARAAARARGIPILEASPTPGAEAHAGQFRLTGKLAAPALPRESSGPEDLALILYTSGMTSRPKAVPLSHRAICTSAHNIASALLLDPRDRCLNVMPLFHAHGLIIALLASLTAGGAVMCAPGFSAEDFFAWLRDFRPTWYTAAPTIHHAVVESAAGHRDLLDQIRLRFIRSSAAFLPPAVKAGLERNFGSPVIEAYGMTECTQITSNPLHDGQRRAGSVGISAGPTVAILDPSGNRLPPGQPGEIVIRGPAVMLGYDRNPEANETAFVNGWFRTGDLGALSADGYLTLTGRLKDIINCGGEKLAPSEVDAVLMDHPAVFQAVSFGVPHPTLGEDVAAAVVLRKAGSVTERELRDFAATRLTDYKVPRQIVIVEEIPKGPTGKLKRAGLAEALGLAAPAGARLHGSPPPPPAPKTDSIERQVAKIWSELLNVEPIEAGANFFRLGGDSILASRLVARVRKQFQVDLPLRSLFETPTLSELSSTIERRKRQPGLSAPMRDTGWEPTPRAALSSDPAGLPALQATAAPVTLLELPAPAARTRKAPVAFSLFFFSSDGSTASEEKYRLVLEASQFADRHGYAAVWTPERHFHSFGGLYPNPAVLGAAIATVTNRIQIRAASVVLTLQNPIRVAEEWAVVDNLSRGRVGVSFASGWHVNDFVLWPSNYGDRHRVMLERVQRVQDLWEGKPITAPNGAGNEVAVHIFPPPLQSHLPIWFSCQSDAMFRTAGELGAGVVTSMFLMSVEELAGKIAIYQEARAARGHNPATGRVVVSLHTYLAEDPAAVREKVSGAYLDYLLVNLGLQADRVRGSGDEFEMPDEDREFLTRQASERLFAERGLVGTVAGCRERVASLAAIGVNEIACLIDFGIDFDSVMAGLYQLNRLKDLCSRSMEVSPGER